MQIGLIAEDRSDVEVIQALTKKLSSRQYSFKPFVGGGCGKIRQKCAAWAQNLSDRGCTHLIIIHDLDEKDEPQLRAELEKSVRHIVFQGTVVLIPVHEIEAWLLADPEAIARALGLSKLPKAPKHPESVMRPKEMLRDLAWKCGKRRYINTIHNPKIAIHLRTDKLRACPSFARFPPFVGGIIRKKTAIAVKKTR